MGMSVRTAGRTWTFARAWLRRQIGGQHTKSEQKVNMSKDTKSSGSFFSRPPERADRSWDGGYPGPPCANHAGPGSDTPPRPPRVAPAVAPTRPVSATPPRPHQFWLGRPRVGGMPAPRLHSSTPGDGLPSRIAPAQVTGVLAENWLAVGARSLAPPQATERFAPTYSPTRPEAEPLTLGAIPEPAEFV
jgi:hypothetical protein